MIANNIETIINSWVEVYTEKLLSWACYKVSDKELAEDLVQDTFIAAFQSFDKFKGDSNPKTWLLSILNHKIIDHYRKDVKNVTVSLNDADNKDRFFDENGDWRKEARPQEWDIAAEHLLDDADFNKTLKNCMSHLPATWLAAVQLKYLGEKNGNEICQELNITPTNFWKILQRAKLQLRGCLEKNWFKK